MYHLLMTYIGTWPAILTCLLTLLATLACHGAELLVKHVVDMSKVNKDANCYQLSTFNSGCCSGWNSINGIPYPP